MVVYRHHRGFGEFLATACPGGPACYVAEGSGTGTQQLVQALERWMGDAVAVRAETLRALATKAVPVLAGGEAVPGCTIFFVNCSDASFPAQDAAELYKVGGRRRAMGQVVGVD